MASGTSKNSPELLIEEVVTLNYSYPAVISISEQTIVISIFLIPKFEMLNLPIEVEIKGHFRLDIISKSQQNNLEVT